MTSLQKTIGVLVGASLFVVGCNKASPSVHADNPQPSAPVSAVASSPSSSASPSAVASTPALASASAVAASSNGCPTGMAAIPGGVLKPADGSADVTVAPFCMDVNEVTVARYRKCFEAGKCPEPIGYDKENAYIFCNWKHPGAPRENHPINCIPGRKAAVALCAYESKTIPTDAQWEWAASGGPHHWAWPWGDTRPTQDQANLAGTTYCDHPTAITDTSCLGSLPGYGAGHFAETAPVGSLPQGDNPWGVHDLIGNVAEFTTGDVPTYPGLAPDPRIRGGAFHVSHWVPIELKVHDGDVLGGSGGVGFRCVFRN